MAESSIALRMVGIVKTFPGVVALDGVDFVLGTGEIHALVGQNGAGKSTLMKILSGEYTASRGHIRLGDDGVDVEIGSPRAAQDLGIAIVQQELSLAPNLTVSQSVALGRETTERLGFLNNAADTERTRRLLETLGAPEIDPAMKISELPVAHRQLVEIAKALALEPRVLILDEPTASLSATEAQGLFDVLRRLSRQSISIVFITHRLREILELCERATVLRNGRVVETVTVADINEEHLIDLILGDRVEPLSTVAPPAPTKPAEKGLTVESLCAGTALRDASFSVSRGEVFGLTGLLGAGQRSVARSIFGILPVESGRILWGTALINGLAPRRAIQHGIGFLAEDRRGEGLFSNLTVGENITLPSIDRFSRGPLGLISAKRERRAALKSIEQLHIVAASVKAGVRTLSGGNQQKTLLARWLLREAELLILEEPTHGVDVGGKVEIHRILRELATRGRAILVISVEVNELLTYCDRIGVMSEGRFAAEFKVGSVTEAQVQRAVQGIDDARS